MVRTTCSEEIKSEAMTIHEFVKMDFDNTLDVFEPKFYNRYKANCYDSYDGILQEVELKDILDKRIPDWVYNDEYTEEEQELVEKIYDDVFSDFMQEYRDEWDRMTQDYYDSKNRDAEERLGTDERYSEYTESKAIYESKRDSYYGWCMNGGGGKKAFRKMYQDGNYMSYGEWLLENYGDE